MVSGRGTERMCSRINKTETKNLALLFHKIHFLIFRVLRPSVVLALQLHLLPCFPLPHRGGPHEPTQRPRGN
jgi:hypothetical protein